MAIVFFDCHLTVLIWIPSRKSGHKQSFYDKGGWRIIYLNYFIIWAVPVLLWIDYRLVGQSVVLGRFTRSHNHLYDHQWTEPLLGWAVELRLGFNPSSLAYYLGRIPSLLIESLVYQVYLYDFFSIPHSWDSQ